ncbi:MAG: Flp family type IVb pilin [Chloroflexia bacterium]|nr:Flp family type IVb pilin [Chloroflexia bacterium]
MHGLFVARQQGQGLVEYALILLLIAIVVIAALTIIGPRVSAMFGTVYNSLAGS